MPVMSSGPSCLTVYSIVNVDSLCFNTAMPSLPQPSDFIEKQARNIAFQKVVASLKQLSQCNDVTDRLMMSLFVTCCRWPKNVAGEKLCIKAQSQISSRSITRILMLHLIKINVLVFKTHLLELGHDRIVF